jgi:hypothetical protein
MIFELNWARFGALIVVGAAAVGCGQEPTDPGAPETSPRESSGFTHERPPTAGGLEVLVQPDEDPLRPGYFDFGEVALGGIVTHTFVLQNKDPRRVVLQKVDPGCGCTVARIGKRLPDGSLEPELTDRPNERMHLEPGDIVEVALRVDTTAIRDKNIDKHFMVRLASDSVRRPFLTLECHLFVRQRFQVAPAAIDLGAIAIGAGGEGKLTIKSVGPELDELTGLGPLPPGVIARLEPGAFADSWVLHAGFLPPLTKGRVASQILVHTQNAEGESGRDLSINLVGTGVDDITVTPPRLIIRPAPKRNDGLDPQAHPARIEAQLVSHLAGQRFKITGYDITGAAAGGLRLEVEAYQPSPDGSSGKWNLALVTTETPKLPSFTGAIMIELDDPHVPRIEVPYAGLGF